MDIMTSVGLIAGIIVIATMMLLAATSHVHLRTCDHHHLRGSIAATMIRFPLAAMLHGLPLGRNSLSR